MEFWLERHWMLPSYASVLQVLEGPRPCPRSCSQLLTCNDLELNCSFRVSLFQGYLVSNFNSIHNFNSFLLQSLHNHRFRALGNHRGCYFTHSISSAFGTLYTGMWWHVLVVLAAQGAEAQWSLEPGPIMESCLKKENQNPFYLISNHLQSVVEQHIFLWLYNGSSPCPPPLLIEPCKRC